MGKTLRAQSSSPLYDEPDAYTALIEAEQEQECEAE